MSTPDSGSIRIGHAERDRAVETLRDAAADGRLTIDELDGRIEAALAAKTRGDLRPLLADLLPPAELESAVNTSVAAAVRAGEPGWTWQEPLSLTARWDDVVRAGAWEVPPFLELHPVAATVKLNFVDARVHGEVIDVVVHGGAGDAVLIVPDGWGVDISRVEKKGVGSVKSTVASRPTGRLPLLVVRGRASLGDVKARHPNRFDAWQRRRRLDRGGGIYAKN